MGAIGAAPVIPATPTVLTATADSDSINLAWTENGTYDTVAIDRKTTGDYTSLAVISGGIATYDDTSAVLDVAYTYQVRGTRNGYPSLNSNSASATVTQSFAAAASDGTATNYLGGGDPASLRVNPSTDSFIIGGWFKRPTSVGRQVLMENGSWNDGVEYWSMLYNDTANRVSFAMNIDSDGVDHTLNELTDLSDDTLYFAIGWFDQAASTMHVKVNDSIANLGVVLIGTPSATGDVRAFVDPSGLYSYTGTLDEWFFCKNPPDLAAALSLISSTIYNSGTGTHYSSLTAGNKTTLGLVSWWGFDEAAGATRKDLHGTNDLSLNGTITQVTSLV